MIAQWQQEAESDFEQSGEKVRRFYELYYAAKSWHRQRKIIAKIEHTSKGNNPRYIATNLTGEPRFLYDKRYCTRGDMENRIKEQQLALFADRTSCHYWWANQFRLLLSSLAYILLETIRRVALKDTELANVYVSTLRLKLIKIGTVILRNTRRIRLLLASSSILKTLLPCCGQTDAWIAHFKHPKLISTAGSEPVGTNHNLIRLYNQICCEIRSIKANLEKNLIQLAYFGHPTNKILIFF